MPSYPLHQLAKFCQTSIACGSTIVTRLMMVFAKPHATSRRVYFPITSITRIVTCKWNMHIETKKKVQLFKLSKYIFLLFVQINTTLRHAKSYPLHMLNSIPLTSSNCLNKSCKSLQMGLPMVAYLVMFTAKAHATY